MTVAIARDVHRQLKLLAAIEGLTVEELVRTACELLCDTYAAAPEPVTASTRTVRSTVTAGPGITTTIASGAVGHWGVVPADVSRSVVTATPEQIAYGTAAGGGRTVVVKRGPGRPRKAPAVDQSGDRCRRCDHTRGEHCGENGHCLSARCVCREFTT